MTKPIYGKTNPSPEESKNEPSQRFGSVIELIPEKEEYYRMLHANAWDSVQRQISASNIKNYNIFITEISGKKYLFSFFEYTGNDFSGDMEKMAADPETQRWWKECIPCQKPLSKESHWLDMERVFFQE